MYTNMNILTKALDASWKRNEVISNNIANKNTPDFKKSRVEFENILNKHLNSNKLQGVTTNEKHIPIGKIEDRKMDYQIEVDHSYSTRTDGNNVDIDVEMGELAKNQITYNTITSRIQSNFQKTKFIINEGR